MQKSLLTVVSQIDNAEIAENMLYDLRSRMTLLAIALALVKFQVRLSHAERKKMTLSSTKLIKVIVVTDDLDKTSKAYKKLLGTGTEPITQSTEDKMIRTPFTTYKGEAITDTPMKVDSVFSDNFWFEIIQPLGDNDPWADWLKAHGTSICSICLMSDGALENDEATMADLGFASLFKQEKGYEAYEYFDTAEALGVLVEVKEHY